ELVGEIEVFRPHGDRDHVVFDDLVVPDDVERLLLSVDRILDASVPRRRHHDLARGEELGRLGASLPPDDVVPRRSPLAISAGKARQSADAQVTMIAVPVAAAVSGPSFTVSAWPFSRVPRRRWWSPR